MRFSNSVLCLCVGLQWFSALIESNPITLFVWRSLVPCWEVWPVVTFRAAAPQRKSQIKAGLIGSIGRSSPRRIMRVICSCSLAETSWQTAALEIINGMRGNFGLSFDSINMFKMFGFFFSLNGGSFFLVALSHDVNSERKMFRLDVISGMFALQLDFLFFIYLLEKKKKRKHSFFRREPNRCWTGRTSIVLFARCHRGVCREQTCFRFWNVCQRVA